MLYDELKKQNPRLTYPQFEKKHAQKIRPVAPEYGHWRIFARPDSNAERPHLIELNKEYFDLYPEQDGFE